MSKRNAIAIVADRSLLPPATFLGNRLAALNNRKDTDIIVFSERKAGIGEARRIAEGVQFREVDFDESFEADFKPSARFPAATYFRFCIPRLLNGAYAKILYVDVDTYPVSDALFDLFGLRLGDAPLAAARAVTDVFRNGYRSGEQGDRVLNSGLLLIDCENYTRKRIEERSLVALRKRDTPPPSADQDIFNEVLQGDWLELSPRFNLNFKLAYSEIAGAYEPVLLHFIGTHKSWDTPTAAMNHPARKELQAFLAGTVWRRYLADRRFTSRALKHYLRTAGRYLGLATKQREKIRPLTEIGLDLPRLVDFATNTDFADARQGLTMPHPEALQKLRNIADDVGSGRSGQ